MRVYVLQNDFTQYRHAQQHFEISSSFTMVLYDPMIGISFGKENIIHHFEFHTMVMKNPNSGSFEVGFFYGIGSKFLF